MGYNNRNNGYIGFVSNTPVASTKAIPLSSVSRNNTSLLLRETTTNGQQNNTFVDSSTNNFTITRNGTPTQGSFSPYGDLWSNYFSSTGQFLTTPSNAALAVGTGNFTYECFVYLNALNGLRGIAGQLTSTDTSGNNSINFYTNGSALNVVIQNNSVAAFNASTTVVTGQWYHVVMVRSGTTVSAYVNGTRIGTATNSTDIVKTSFIVGRVYTNDNNYYGDNYVSNLRLVKGTAIYDPTLTTLTVPTTPLTAVSGTSLLTCQSNRFRDNSSNNFSITATGTPSVQRFSPFDPAAEYSTSVIGGSGYFGGTNQYLTVPDNAAFTFGSGDWTIESWVYTGVSSGNQAIIGQCSNTGGANTGSFVLYASVGGYARIMVGIGANWQWAQSSTLLPLNQWVHLAGVRSGSTVTLYMNGVSVGTYAISTNTINDSAFSVAVGRTGEFNGEYLNGYTSNVRVVKGTAVYTAAFTPPIAPVTAITNTSLLLNTVNAGIFDNAMINNLVTVDNAQASTTQVKNSTSSLYFDGTNDYIYCVDSGQFDFGTGDFTVEAWIRPSSVATSINNIAGGLGPTNGDWMFALDSSTQLRWGRNHVAWDLTTSGVTFSANTWYHIAACRSGTSLRLFVDGIERAIATNSTAYDIANSFLAIGARQANSSSFGPGNFFNGYMEDFRIVKGFAVYTANFTPPSTPLTTTVTTSTFTFSDYYNTGVLTNIENQTQFALNSVPGLAGKFFNGTNWRSVLSTGDIGTLPLTTTNDSSNVTGTTGLPSAAHRYGVNAFTSITYSSVGDNYGFIAIGYFKPPTTGSYTFYTSSDDSSGMWLGSIAMANSGRTAANALVNNGISGPGQGDTKRSGTITLYAGVWYPVRVVHEEGGGGDNLTFSWSGPGIAETTDLSQHFRTPANGNILIGHYI